MFVPDGKNYRIDLDANRSFIIGNENAGSFEPHIRASRWGGEGDISWGLPGRGIPPVLTNGRVEWTDGDVKHRFYQINSGVRVGNIEYDIILGSRPAGTRLNIPFEMSGLRAAKQPPLTQFEIDRGNDRPIDVVNSYAFYHLTKGVLNSSRDAAKDYQTGMAFHLYRPLAIDALNNRKYLDMDISANTLTIHLDPVFFANATYPVTIDPDLGYTSDGASTDSSNSYMMGNQYTTDASGGDTGDFHAYCNAGSGTVVFIGGIYEGGATPESAALVGAQSATWSSSSSTSAWLTGAIVVSLAASTAYWVDCLSDTNGRLRYDGGSNVQYYVSQTAGLPRNMPDPWPSSAGGSLNWDMSLYVDYTAASGGITNTNMVGSSGRIAGNYGGLVG